MDKTKTVLHEGYVYREEKLNGQAEVLYCVLKPNTLSFHRRKVHKRHTPLGLLKLEELSIDIEDYTDGECNNGSDVWDCNHNSTRFPWKIVSGEHKLFLFCASFEDRSAWIDAVEAAQAIVCSVAKSHEDVRTNGKDDGTNVKHDYGAFVESANEQSELTSEVIGSVENHQLLSQKSKSVDNSSHTASQQDHTVGNEDEVLHHESKKRTRVRSRSLSEVEKPEEVIDSEQYTRCMKSKSAPPDNGKRGCKTVDKLMHTGLCRQLVLKMDLKRNINHYIYQT